MHESSESLPVRPAVDKAAETQERERAWARARTAGVAAPRQEPPSDLRQLSCASIVHNVREYAMFVLDPQGVIRLWGESARLMKWWTAHEAEGAHLRLMYPDGGSEDGTAESHLEFAAERGEYTGAGHRVRSDCSTFYARVTLTALKDPQGRLHGFAKVVRDFTADHAAQLNAEQAIRFATEEQKRAEAVAHAKSLFAATVSHEIRGPLNAMLGYVKLLEHQSASLPDLHKADLDRILRIGGHLMRVVGDVLDQTRLESGRFIVAGALNRLGSAVDAAVLVAQQEASDKAVDLVNAVAAYGADVSYFGDENRVRQILINLIGNAVKFTPSGGLVKVSAGLAETASPEAQLGGTGPWVYVRVEDTGPGISDEHLSRIFEPFEQADAKDAVLGRGSGLGLAISRRLARLMGGDVTVRTQPGHGSTFFLWLPTRNADAPPWEP